MLPSRLSAERVADAGVLTLCLAITLGALTTLDEVAYALVLLSCVLLLGSGVARFLR